jgi:hypothetical protein
VELLNLTIGSLSSGVVAATSSYESIASATGTGSSGTITFSSIPNTYVALQIRYMVLSTTSATDWADIRLRFNSVSGTSYARHELQGSDSTVSAYGVANNAQIYAGVANYGTSNATPMTGIIDIHNYASTTQNKTVRIFSGIDVNAASGSCITLRSGLFNNTSAISSIELALSTSNYSTTTTFALYGIKGA